MKLLKIFILLLLNNAIFAATTTTTFQVTATVLSSCSVSATNLNFGNYIPTAVSDSTSTITVTCTVGTTYDVGLDGGSSGDVLNREMTDGLGNTLDYFLYQDPARTVNWGNTVGVDTVTGTGDGTPDVLTVYGRIPANQYVPPGNYLDTITVTVTYP